MTVKCLDIVSQGSVYSGAFSSYGNGREQYDNFVEVNNEFFKGYTTGDPIPTDFSIYSTTDLSSSPTQELSYTSFSSNPYYPTCRTRRIGNAVYMLFVYRDSSSGIGYYHLFGCTDVTAPGRTFSLIWQRTHSFPGAYPYSHDIIDIGGTIYGVVWCPSGASSNYRMHIFTNSVFYTTSNYGTAAPKICAGYVESDIYTTIIKNGSTGIHYWVTFDGSSFTETADTTGLNMSSTAITTAYYQFWKVGSSYFVTDRDRIGYLYPNSAWKYYTTSGSALSIKGADSNGDMIIRWIGVTATSSKQPLYRINENGGIYPFETKQYSTWSVFGNLPGHDNGSFITLSSSYFYRLLPSTTKEGTSYTPYVRSCKIREKEGKMIIIEDAVNLSNLWSKGELGFFYSENDELKFAGFVKNYTENTSPYRKVEFEACWVSDLKRDVDFISGKAYDNDDLIEYVFDNFSRYTGVEIDTTTKTTIPEFNKKSLKKIVEETSKNELYKWYPKILDLEWKIYINAGTNYPIIDYKYGKEFIQQWGTWVIPDLSDWTDASGTGCNVSIIERSGIHRNVMRLNDESSSTACDIRLPLTGTTLGSFEFWLKTSDNTKQHTIEIGTDASNCIDLYISGGNLNYYDGSGHVIQAISNDTWYHILITYNFASTWSISINGGTATTGLNYKGTPTTMSYFILLSIAGTTDYQLYIDAIRFSWIGGSDNTSKYVYSASHDNSPYKVDGWKNPRNIMKVILTGKIVGGEPVEGVYEEPTIEEGDVIRDLFPDESSKTKLDGLAEDVYDLMNNNIFQIVFMINNRSPPQYGEQIDFDFPQYTNKFSEFGSIDNYFNNKCEYDLVKKWIKIGGSDQYIYEEDKKIVEDTESVRGTTTELSGNINPENNRSAILTIERRANSSEGDGITPAFQKLDADKNYGANSEVINFDDIFTGWVGFTHTNSVKTYHTETLNRKQVVELMAGDSEEDLEKTITYSSGYYLSINIRAEAIDKDKKVMLYEDGVGVAAGIQMDSTGIWQVRRNGSWVSLQRYYGLAIDTWYHVMLYYDGSNVKYWINGYLVYENTTTDSYTPDTFQLQSTENNDGNSWFVNAPYHGTSKSDALSSKYDGTEICKGIILNGEDIDVKHANNDGSEYVGFSARRDTTQSIPSGSYTTVIFPDDTHNDDELYDPSTGIFTAPVDGKYKFTSAVLFTPSAWVAGETAVICFTVNTTAQRYRIFYECKVSGTDYVHQFISKTLNLSEGDTVEVEVYQNTGIAINVHGNDAYNWFDGVLLK